ncbi:MAG: diguanylate cyclase [Candidatus Methylopumilus sp.]|nr:diguanylate cyclase [Candidatus Methylopumilus sp.]
MILSINHIQLVAEKDLAIKLRDFYCGVVGLQEGFRPNFERFGFWLYIGEKDAVHLITPKEGDSRSLQKSSYDHVAFKASDYAGVLKKLKLLDFPFEEKLIPGMIAHQIFLKDPAGNRVELNFEELK